MGAGGAAGHNRGRADQVVGRGAVALGCLGPGGACGQGADAHRQLVVATGDQAAEAVVAVGVGRVGCGGVTNVAADVVGAAVAQGHGDAADAAVGAGAAAVAVVVLPDIAVQQGRGVVAEIDVGDRLVDGVDRVEVAGEVQATGVACVHAPEPVAGAAGGAVVDTLAVAGLGHLGSAAGQRAGGDTARDHRRAVGDLHKVEAWAQAGEAVVAAAVGHGAGEQTPTANPSALGGAVGARGGRTCGVLHAGACVNAAEELHRHAGDADVAGAIAGAGGPARWRNIAEDTPADRAVLVDRHRDVVEGAVGRATVGVACAGGAGEVGRALALAGRRQHAVGHLDRLGLAGVERADVVPGECAGRDDVIGGGRGRDELQAGAVEGVGEGHRAEDRIVAAAGLVGGDNIDGRVKVHLAGCTAATTFVAGHHQLSQIVREIGPSPWAHPGDIGLDCVERTTRAAAERCGVTKVTGGVDGSGGAVVVDIDEQLIGGAEIDALTDRNPIQHRCDGAALVAEVEAAQAQRVGVVIHVGGGIIAIWQPERITLARPGSHTGSAIRD